MVTELEANKRIRALIAASGRTLEQASEKLGYTPKHLCMVRSGKKPIPAPLLLAVGLKRVAVYEDLEARKG
jgi:hypothetical protein